jgi:endonuclease YncB( thermonuclease family)
LKPPEHRVVAGVLGLPKAITTTKSGLVSGHLRLGARGGVAGSIRQQVHDGDTIVVEADGNLGVRFLGVDAPEISFQLPGATAFTGLSDPRWEAFLRNPFTPSLPQFDPPLDERLRKYLRQRVGPGTALNHHRHASAAEVALEGEVTRDAKELNQSPGDFRFFMAFAYELVDRYGRLLGYINREQIDDKKPTPRPPSYNERLLKAGLVVPYFIWPNINPFRKQKRLDLAVPNPGSGWRTARDEPTLKQAREWTQSAREAKIGVYAPGDGLRLQPFEVRFLARRTPPDRWLANLAKDEAVLIPPQEYFTVPHAEDRLFVPTEYLALFEKAGWKRQAA